MSVIIVSYRSRATIRAVLASLREQTVQGFQTVLVDSSADCSAEELASEYPEIRVIAVAERMYPGQARNLGIRSARGKLVAFVDADCLAEPDWVEQILAAHNDPKNASRMIIGGSVGVANPENEVGWASFFCEFSPWLRSGQARVLEDVPTCCYSMKREAFDRYGPFAEDGYCSDTILNWRAKADGQAPLFVPEIHVRHINPGDWRRILAKQGMHGERFGEVRAREQDWGRWRALGYALAAPLLPLVIYFRIASRACREASYRWRFLRATPLLIMVLGAWGLREAFGYWRYAWRKA